MSDTASILSRTSKASSSSSSSSLSTASSRSGRGTRSSGRGGVGNIKYGSKDCISLTEAPAQGDAVSIANGRETPAGKPDSTHSTGRSGAGNIMSSTIVREASRVGPGQHALTEALVSAQAETQTKYERRLMFESQEAARHGRHTYGRGGAGNSASPSKPKAPKSPKVTKSGQKSRLINYGSLRGLRRTPVTLDVVIPEESDVVETTIMINRKDLGRMRKAFAKSLLALRTAEATVSIAAPVSPPPTTVALSSPASLFSAPSSPEADTTPPSSAPSTLLSSGSSACASVPITGTAISGIAIAAAASDPGVIVFPQDEDTLAYQLAALQLRKSWTPRAKRETLPSLRSDAESISCADLDWMEGEWADGAESGADDEHDEHDEKGGADIVHDGLNLNAVMYALLEEARRG